MPETLMQWAAVGQLPQFHTNTINARESMHRVKVKIVCTAVQQIINALFHFKRQRRELLQGAAPISATRAAVCNSARVTPPYFFRHSQIITAEPFIVKGF